MRALSADFAAALASGATTLCHCWRVARHDGIVLGFTDHDRDVTVHGTPCLAGTGLDGSQAHASLGLAVDTGDVQGALDAQSLTEDDLSTGRYDDASVEIWIVDWTDATRAVLMDVATIGEVRRSEHSFVAELRSLAHRFDEEIGRRFQRACSADLGDARCRVDLTNATFETTGAVTAGRGPAAVLTTLDGSFRSGFFTGGVMTVVSGSRIGERVAIRTHTQIGDGHLLVAVTGPIGSLAAGDGFRVSAGCDKSPETCRGKFDNLANFRGFPHMPGNDVMMSYANSHSPVMDGGSLFR